MSEYLKKNIMGIETIELKNLRQQLSSARTNKEENSKNSTLNEPNPVFIKRVYFNALENLFDAAEKLLETIDTQKKKFSKDNTLSAKKKIKRKKRKTKKSRKNKRKTKRH